MAVATVSSLSEAFSSGVLVSSDNTGLLQDKDSGSGKVTVESTILQALAKFGDNIQQYRAVILKLIQCGSTFPISLLITPQTSLLDFPTSSFVDLRTLQTQDNFLQSLFCRYHPRHCQGNWVEAVRVTGQSLWS